MLMDSCDGKLSCDTRRVRSGGGRIRATDSEKSWEGGGRNSWPAPKSKLLLLRDLGQVREKMSESLEFQGAHSGTGEFSSLLSDSNAVLLVALTVGISSSLSAIFSSLHYDRFEFVKYLWRLSCLAFILILFSKPLKIKNTATPVSFEVFQKQVCLVLAGKCE